MGTDQCGLRASTTSCATGEHGDRSAPFPFSLAFARPTRFIKIEWNPLLISSGLGRSRRRRPLEKAAAATESSNGSGHVVGRTRSTWRLGQNLRFALPSTEIEPSIHIPLEQAASDGLLTIHPSHRPPPPLLLWAGRRDVAPCSWRQAGTPGGVAACDEQGQSCESCAPPAPTDAEQREGRSMALARPSLAVALPSVCVDVEACKALSSYIETRKPPLFLIKHPNQSMRSIAWLTGDLELGSIGVRAATEERAARGDTRSTPFCTKSAAAAPRTHTHPAPLDRHREHASTQAAAAAAPHRLSGGAAGPHWVAGGLRSPSQRPICHHSHQPHGGPDTTFDPGPPEPTKRPPSCAHTHTHQHHTNITPTPTLHHTTPPQPAAAIERSTNNYTSTTTTTAKTMARFAFLRLLALVLLALISMGPATASTAIGVKPM